MEWNYGKPKHEQEVWVVHYNDPVHAIFLDVGTCGAYFFVDYDCMKAAYKCGPWIPYSDIKPEYVSEEQKVEMPF